MKKVTKNQYIKGFCMVVLLLALVRCIFPEVASGGAAVADGDVPAVETVAPVVDSQTAEPSIASSAGATPLVASSPRVFRLPEERPHRIWGVSNYQTSFPDSNNVQLAVARQWGVSPVRNRQDAELRKKELVYIGLSPYYHVDPLYSSIPYLVPRAAVLLQDIGQAFYDSLYAKGIPLNQLIVTSVLRSQDDVAKLRRRNGNATENSCHLYGTTFDISYTRYQPLTRPVRDDSLKYVLCEVLRDMRENGRCYIKYEVKQSCFHMTVR